MKTIMACTRLVAASIIFVAVFAFGDVKQSVASMGSCSSEEGFGCVTSRGAEAERRCYPDFDNDVPDCRSCKSRTGDSCFYMGGPHLEGYTRNVLR